MLAGWLTLVRAGGGARFARLRATGTVRFARVRAGAGARFARVRAKGRDRCARQGRGVVRETAVVGTPT